MEKEELKYSPRLLSRAEGRGRDKARERGGRGRGGRVGREGNGKLSTHRNLPKVGA